MLRALALAALSVTPALALVGGEPVGPDLAPHLVMISGQRGFCSGVVIGPDLVLTAAHCVHPGTAYRVLWFEGGAPVMAAPSAILRHPRFDPDAYKRRSFTVDVALVRLAAPLPARFIPLDLPATGEDGLPGARYRVAGFGPTSADDPQSAGVAREATLIGRPPVSDVQLRLGAPGNGRAGACTGDSGGPVFRVSDAGGAPVPPRLVGIMGSAQGCGGRTGTQLLGPALGWIAENR